MKTILLLTLLLSAVSHAKCPKYTDEQENSINLAYFYGTQFDLGYTLAAITIKESFVGDYIVRVNSKDGKYGSYGITHIELSTAMWLEGIKNSWKARAEIVPKLMKYDGYSWSLSIKKLKSYRGSDWMGRWASYNGSGPKAREYAIKIRDNVRMLEKCYKSLSDWDIE